MGIAQIVLRKFHGGVHPPEYKNLSEHCAIEGLPMPKRLYVPLHQHLGKPADPCVAVGSKVLKGDRIGQPDGFISAAVHAPTSGTVVGIEEYTVGHPSGLTMPCMVIEPDGEDRWSPHLQGLTDPLKADPAAIRKKVLEAGIVGLGGATFPTAVKLSPPQGKVAELLVLNGVECEPYLTCDARLMEERGRDVVQGAEIMLQALQTKRCVIAIEDNKPGAIQAMQALVANHPAIQVQPLPVRYPQGAEKQLIEALTGRQVPSGGLPIDVGVIVHNVATAAAVRDAVVYGKPLVSRLVTVTGLGIRRPANVEALIGTPVSALIQHCGGLKAETVKVVMGGPMMGVALGNLDVPVVKGTSGLLAMTAAETQVGRVEQACIRCGNCVRVCPISLMPTEMAWYSRHEQWDKLKEYDVFDCIECGSCAYVCPASIPLVQYFRFGKLSLLANDRDKKKADIAKARTKAKEARVEQEKLEKERKKAEMKGAARKPAAAEEKSEDAPAATPAAPGEAPAADDKAARAARAAAAAKAAREAKAAAQGEAPAAPVEAPAAPAVEAAPAGAEAPAGDAAADEKAARAARAAAAARAAKAAREARAAAAAKGEGTTE